MPLDHSATAKQLTEDARRLTLLKANVCHTTHEKKTIQAIIDHTLGLADWHREQVARATPSAPDPEAENELDAGNELLETDPLLGKTVQILTGPFNGSTGTISKLHPTGRCDVELSGTQSIFTLESLRPALDFGLRITN